MPLAGPVALHIKRSHCDNENQSFRKPLFTTCNKTWVQQNLGCFAVLIICPDKKSAAHDLNEV